MEINMRIDGVENGVVIDHIPAGRGMELYRYLKLDDVTCEVALIKNVPSQKRGKKDILKINENIELDFDLLGYIDPNITVNIVKDSVLVKKRHPGLPARITDVIRCRNPRCITSTEQELPHIFKLTDPEKGVYRCVYCEERARK